MGLLKYTSKTSARPTPVAARVATPGQKPSGTTQNVAPGKPAMDVGSSYEKRLEHYIRGVNSNL